MKKSLLSVALAVVASAGYAQQKVADASNWKVGEDISDKIEWGNLKFENNPMDYWTLAKGAGSTTQTGGLFEVYDGSDCDLFQYVYLPKGQYRLQCQGYYRCGGSDQNDTGDPTAFDSDEFEYNAKLYVQDGTYNQDTKEFKKGYLRFENPLMPRLYEMRGEQLFFAYILSACHLHNTPKNRVRDAAAVFFIVVLYIVPPKTLFSNFENDVKGL